MKQAALLGLLLLLPHCWLQVASSLYHQLECATGSMRQVARYLYRKAHLQLGEYHDLSTLSVHLRSSRLQTVDLLLFCSAKIPD